MDDMIKDQDLNQPLWSFLYNSSQAPGCEEKCKEHAMQWLQTDGKYDFSIEPNVAIKEVARHAKTAVQELWDAEQALSAGKAKFDCAMLQYKQASERTILSHCLKDSPNQHIARKEAVSAWLTKMEDGAKRPLEPLQSKVSELECMMATRLATHDDAATHDPVRKELFTADDDVAAVADQLPDDHAKDSVAILIMILQVNNVRCVCSQPFPSPLRSHRTLRQEPAEAVAPAEATPEADRFEKAAATSKAARAVFNRKDTAQLEATSLQHNSVGLHSKNGPFWAFNNAT